MILLLFLSLLAPPPKPTVVLSWVDNLNQRTATYSVYRGESVCTASPQMQRLVADVIEKTWTDTDIKQNRSYCYFVTAINSGYESEPSGRVTVTIPRPSTLRR